MVEGRLTFRDIIVHPWDLIEVAGVFLYNTLSLWEGATLLPDNSRFGCHLVYLSQPTGNHSAMFCHPKIVELNLI